MSNDDKNYTLVTDENSGTDAHMQRASEPKNYRPHTLVAITIPVMAHAQEKFGVNERTTDARLIVQDALNAWLENDVVTLDDLNRSLDAGKRSASASINLDDDESVAMIMAQLRTALDESVKTTGAKSEDQRKALARELFAEVESAHGQEKTIELAKRFKKAHVDFFKPTKSAKSSDFKSVLKNIF